MKTVAKMMLCNAVAFGLNSVEKFVIDQLDLGLGKKANFVKVGFGLVELFISESFACDVKKGGMSQSKNYGDVIIKDIDGNMDYIKTEKDVQNLNALIIEGLLKDQRESLIKDSKHASKSTKGN